jgi:hypothetical protein
MKTMSTTRKVLRRLNALMGLAATALLIASGDTTAASAAMRRVLTCIGPDATIEVYVPESLWTGIGVENARLEKTTAGAYSLDLTEAGKGKNLEPVYVRYSPDKRSVIIDQYTRRLPPTVVPVAGATVDFDHRFATAAKCGPFNQD